MVRCLAMTNCLACQVACLGVLWSSLRVKRTCCSPAWWIEFLPREVKLLTKRESTAFRTLQRRELTHVCSFRVNYESGLEGSSAVPFMGVSSMVSNSWPVSAAVVLTLLSPDSLVKESFQKCKRIYCGRNEAWIEIGSRVKSAKGRKGKTKKNETVSNITLLLCYFLYSIYLFNRARISESDNANSTRSNLRC